MTTSPKYSIVIPTKEGMPYLRYAVASVLASSRADIQLVVSADQSADSSDEYLSNLDDTRVTLVRPAKALSLSDHWDFAQSHATGEWQMFLGQDDLMMTNFAEGLDSLVEAADIKGTSVVVTRRAYLCWPPLREKKLKALQHWKTDQVEIRQSLDFVEKALTTGISYHAGPQMYTSTIVHRDLLTKIRMSQKGQLIIGHPQDAFLAAAILKESPSFLWSGAPIAWVGTSEKSAGLAISKGADNSGLGNLAKDYANSVHSDKKIVYSSTVDFRHGVTARYFLDALFAAWPEVLELKKFSTKKFKLKMDSEFMASYSRRHKNLVTRRELVTLRHCLWLTTLMGYTKYLRAFVLGQFLDVTSKFFASRLKSRYSFHQIKSCDDAGLLFEAARKIRTDPVKLLS